MKKNAQILPVTKKVKIRYVLITALSILVIFIFIPQAVFALEDLSYTPASDGSPTLRLQLDDFLEKNFNSDSSRFVMSSTDLNGDNLLEYILKRKNCGQYTNICTYLIIAEKKEGLTLLSKISAHNLMVGDGKSYGIKNLLAFKNPSNAYDFDIYMWSPHEKMYILKPDKKRD